jgi:hypothetical protein
MFLVPSKEVIIESSLDTATFIQRLATYCEPRKHFVKLSNGKYFVGEISDNSTFNLSYLAGPQWVSELQSWGGPRLEGFVSPSQRGTLVRIQIRLPSFVVAGGLAFAWGTFVIGLTGITIIAASRPLFSLPGFLRATMIVMIPSLIAYGLFYGMLHDYIREIKAFFEANFK